MKIAKEIPEIDLVVGGHTHSFLYTGNPPSNDVPTGEYPTLITQDGGKIVPVVQAFWGTKYLGYMKLNFSKDGEMTSWDNTWNGEKTPILLDGAYEQGMITLLSFYWMHVLRGSRRINYIIFFRSMDFAED